GHQAGRPRPHRAYQAQDLAEDAPDRSLTPRHLDHRVHVFVGGHRRASHVTFTPGGRSRSSERTASLPPEDAARTIPFDSTPISFAASRFATMTTFLPTISAGV